MKVPDTLVRLEAKLKWVRSEMERIQREAEAALQAHHGAAQMLEELIAEGKKARQAPGKAGRAKRRSP